MSNGGAARVGDWRLWGVGFLFLFFLSATLQAVGEREEAAGATELREGKERGVPEEILFTVSIADTTVLEGDAGIADAVLSITLSQPRGVPVTVDFATADGTASEADGDYTAGSGSLTFMPGETGQTIVVAVNGDTRVEGDETLSVALSNPVGAIIDDGQGVVTIRDDDDPPPPTLAIDDVALAEGNGGTRNATFTVTLSAAAAAAVTVDYATADGTATTADGDYQAASGQLTLAAGEISATFTVTVNGDTRVEADETFFVNLSAPTNATLGDGQGQGTIIDDDAAPQPSLSIGNATVSEGDAGSVNASLAVTLSVPSSQPVSVTFATQDGTATVADGDYAAASGTLTLSPGQTSGSIAVQVNGDDRAEGDEAFTVTLGNPQGATISDGVGQVTIRDDDQGVVMQSTIRLLPLPTVLESAGRAMVTAERLAPTSAAAEVTITATAGSAQAGEDFTAASRTLRWGPGQGGTRRISVAILDDSTVEEDETVRIVLSAPVGAVLGTPADGNLVILDDETAVALTAVSAVELEAAVEEAVTLQVRASRADGLPAGGIAVSWGLEGEATLAGGPTSSTGNDGVAANTVRLGAMPGTVTVTASPAGSGASVVFTIAVDGDLGDLFPPGEGSSGSSVADVLDEDCGSATGAFGELCDYVFVLDEDQQLEVISEITPQEVAAQGEIALSGLRLQLGNVGRRLAALRGSASRRAIDDFALDIRGDGVSPSLVKAAVEDYGAAERWATSRLEQALDSPRHGAAKGGGASADPTAAAETPRLGVFVTGRLSVGERPATGREAGFELDSQGLTVGLDYFVSQHFVLGGAVGYLTADGDLEADGGGLAADGYSLSVYAVYQPGRFYVDGALVYGRNEYEISRHIDLPVPFAARSRYAAWAHTESDQTALSLGLGYDWTAAALQIAGLARISYLEAALDGYRERGAGPFDLVIRDQTLESLLTEVGLELGYAASLSWGVLRPSVRFSYLHELEDDGRLIRGRFERDLLGGEFAVPTDEPDRDFFNLGAGLTAVLPHGWTAYLLYDTDLERDDLDFYTLTGGVRCQF